MSLGTCPHCGAPVAKTWKKCPSCGNDLDRDSLSGQDYQPIYSERAEREERERKEREERERIEREEREKREEKERREREEIERKEREKKEAEEAAARAEAARIAAMTPEERAALKAEEERKIKVAKRKKTLTTVSIVLSVVLVIGGIIAYKIINKPVNERLKSVYSSLLAQNYESAKSECDKVYTGLMGLDEEQKCRLAKYYYVIGANAKNQDAATKFNMVLQQLINSQSDSVDRFLNENFPSETTKARLTDAIKLYKDGKIGEANKICNKVNSNFESLSFVDKCTLASLYAAISKVDDDISNKVKCASLYKQAIAFNPSEANSIFEKNDNEFGTKIATVAKEGENINKAKSTSQMISNDIVKTVVVTGTNVRLRLAPNLQSNVLTNSNGENVHPEKGEHLKYLGETSEFYRVEYRGQNVWISKQFTVPSKEEAQVTNSDQWRKLSVSSCGSYSRDSDGWRKLDNRIYVSKIRVDASIKYGVTLVSKENL